MSETQARRRPESGALSAGPTDRLSFLRVFGYGAGDAGNNVAFQFSAMFLLLYYTDVVGLSPAAVGTMFLVIRAWDAVADLVAGRLVDRVQTRWGKFRPFILFGSLPLLLLNVALFHVPHMSSGLQLLYAYVTYALIGLAYSLVNIPYGALATVMTQAPDQRTRLSAARGMGAVTVIIALGALVGSQLGKVDMQSLFSTLTWCFVPLGMAFYLLTFCTARETVRRDRPQVSLRQTLSVLRVNRPLLLLSLSTLVFLTGYSTMIGIAAYYARDVLGDSSLYLVLNLCSAATLLLIVPLGPRLVRRFGKKSLFSWGAGLACVGGLGVVLAPAAPVALPVVAWVAMNLGLNMLNTLTMSFEADAVEYGQWRTGHRAEGATYAVFSFTRKIGQALAGAALGYLLAFGGYSGTTAVQSDGALTSIRLAAGVVPALCALVAALVMRWYPLSDARFREILADLAERERTATSTGPTDKPSTA
ncbi:glucuronide carrier protein [Streptomyces sp. 3330]|uniref:glycoside-pentoside-hexuronide (GPH):cation symporter n=1 Tax=Streptomyces sp. 3330 TaxID=2817755 RepID=UPI00285C91E3|nr:glycoside-pentoside-hexuronide (GPH):cation symporter [Streptomyces sp. 3330]MDR6979645.1 glucuronide carrier protein [Streptomyces sp. 3330]